MNRKRKWTQMVGVICGMALCACQQPPVEKKEAEYGVIEVSSADKVITTAYSATIRGRQDIDIYPQVSGFITRLCVEEGDRVRKGQVLFVIDRVGYEAALRTATANLEAAKAGAATAELTFKSKQELFSQHIISDFDLKTAENAYLLAKAQVAQMEAQEVNARNNLSYTEVKSPSDGIVGTLPYRTGALVGPSVVKPLTTISDNSRMYAYFSMNEKQLLQLTRLHGSKEEVLKSLPAVELKLNDLSNYEEKGRIETISGVVDRSTGTVSLRAAFPNERGILYSGSSANVLLPVRKENAIVIPRNITFEIQDKVYVYKVEEGRTKSVRIQVIPVDGGREYIVSEGLQNGEIIVAEGVGLLREGTPIKTKMKI